MQWGDVEKKTPIVFPVDSVRILSRISISYNHEARPLLRRMTPLKNRHKDGGQARG